ncbi:MAG: anti-sigma factor antagonist [Proteobacteria bacterium]|nr:anti-sigma factor antagonist [Pseudomonadota bacterium]
MATQQCLAINDDLTIYNAQTLKQKLVGAINKYKLIELDLSQVSQIDSAGLQLLIFAKRESTRLNKEIRIVAHSKAVQETIDFCNLATDFGDPVIITASENH